MARYEFTMVSDQMILGLTEAGATANEIKAYIVLVRGLPMDRSKSQCWMHADMAQEKIGMDAHTFSKALRSLCNKTVSVTGGKRVPVITKLTRACKGHSPHYEDTLGVAIARGTYPPSADEMGT